MFISCLVIPGLRSHMRGHMVRVREIWAMVRQEFCHDPWTGFYNGQVIVSAQRILALPARTYRTLYYALDAAAKHSIHMHYMHLESADRDMFAKREHQLDNVLFTHVLERTWSVLWNCTDLSVKENCKCRHDTIHDNRVEEECIQRPNTCQCLDAGPAVTL